MIGFLGKIIADIIGTRLKSYLGDKTYNIIKKVFIFFAVIFWTIVFGYMIVLYLLFSGYEGTWLLYSLNYLHNLFSES